MGRMTVSMNEDMIKRLKMYAIDRGMTASAVIDAALDLYISIAEGAAVDEIGQMIPRGNRHLNKFFDEF